MPGVDNYNYGSIPTGVVILNGTGPAGSPAASPVAVTPQGAGYSATATFTPAAAAYAANDVMEGAKEIATVGPAAGGEVMITTVRFRVDTGAVISGETSYDLHLYSVTPPSALADNAAWDLPSGDRASYRGKISLGAPVDLGSTLYVEQTGINKQVTVPPGGSLWGYLVTVGAFTATAVARVVVVKAVAL